MRDFFLFKQKAAYEMRISDWSSDVCSSDLIAAHVRRGGRVLGLCGGYQMLGRMVGDPDGIEGPAGTVAGLGLLDVETLLTADKALTRTTARHVATGERVDGYEIHIGRIDGTDRARPILELAAVRTEGAVQPQTGKTSCRTRGCQ